MWSWTAEAMEDAVHKLSCELERIPFGERPPPSDYVCHGTGSRLC